MKTICELRIQHCKSIICTADKLFMILNIQLRADREIRKSPATPDARPSNATRMQDQATALECKDQATPYATNTCTSTFQVILIRYIQTLTIACESNTQALLTNI